MAHVRELPPLRETIEITAPSGKRARWGEDEPQAKNIPTDVRSSDTMPGGFETFDATLPRKPGIDYSDLERLSNVRRLDASGGVIWEGRLERAPRASGDRIAISPSAVGWQAHLADDKSVRVVYRDIDLSRWQSPSRQRRVNVLAAGRVVTDHSAEADATTGIPALKMSLQGPWASGIECNALYDSGDASVGRIYWDRTSQSDQGSQPSATFEFQAGTADTDTLTGSDLTGDLHVATGDSEAQSFSPTTPQRWGVFIWRFTAANTTAGEYSSTLRRVAVYGQSGLTARGTEPDAGFYDADIVGHAIGRWCPLLTTTTDSLAASTFVIPHAAFLEPTTVADIIREATRFGLRDWAVWDDKTFWLHDRGARGRRWRARVGPAQLEETGPQVDRLWESVIVQYQDVDGTTRTVGPPGSGADTESGDLKDDDPDNPANRLGITRRDLLQMGVSTAAGATEIGRRFLEETKQLDSSGRATLVGYVEDDRGVLHPYTRVRAGDTISFVDAADTSYRRIVRAEKGRADRTCSIDLDSPPEGLQSLLERLGVVLVPLGVGV